MDINNKKEASEKLMSEINDLSSDDEYVELYTDLSRKELEYNTYIAEAYEEGEDKGKIKCRNEEKLEIAKNLLKQNIDINIISTATVLSIEEINSLK